MANAASSVALPAADAVFHNLTQASSSLPTEAKLWRPRRVLITPEALALPYGRAMLERAASFGAEVIRLPNNRITGVRGESERQTYALAKTTFAIVISPPGQRKLQPIPPSADWQFHIAQAAPHTASTATLPFTLRAAHHPRLRQPA